MCELQCAHIEGFVERMGAILFLFWFIDVLDHKYALHMLTHYLNVWRMGML